MPRDLEARVAGFSSAARHLEFLLHGPHGPASLRHQLAICDAAQQGVQALRRISPLHLAPAFDDAAVDDLDTSVAELAERDVPLLADPFVVEEIGRRLAFVQDNAGNLLELSAPR